MSLVIPANTAFAIVGVSGAGKSTLADIIAGLVVPQSGKLVVDDCVVEAGMLQNWRQGMAYVPQDAPLFDDSIRANLTVAARDATDGEIWNCLEIVEAADLVRGLEQGLDTRVGDRGARLSGGQRQRLRLASALLKKPELLLLDEATNALGPGDERTIVGNLRRLLSSMTIVVIAHRKSSVAWTDSGILLKDGKVAASGPTGALLASAGGIFEMGDALLDTSRQ